MKRITLALIIALLWAGIASAATAPGLLGSGAREAVQLTLGNILSSGSKPAPVTVGTCHWTGPKTGICRVRVQGTTDDCRMLAHVEVNPDSYGVWVEKLKCS